LHDYLTIEDRRPPTVAEDVTVPSTYLRASDLGYEYEVRGKQPPFDLVKEDLEVVFAAIYATNGPRSGGRKSTMSFLLITKRQ
jgi:hypothetical protein